MEFTPELSDAFAPGAVKIRNVRLIYRNGGEVNGTIRKLKLSPGNRSPIRLVLEKSDPAQGERTRHRAVFEHVKALEVHYTDGTSAKFP